MSLLLDREPFGEILTETLTPFWSRLHGQPMQVDWLWNPPRRQLSGNGDDFRWLGNVYLNAIFPAGINSQALEPIRREFSRSVVAWRRPWQQAYVALALAPRSARWFTHAVLRVAPVVESFRQQVIVPGNNKIRILDRQADSVYGIQKAGFSRDRFIAEIEAREQAESLGIPVPQIVESDLAAGWFREQYVVGTPLNRLASQQKVTSITQRAAGSLQRLAEETREKTTLRAYVAALQTSIGRHLDAVLTLENLTRAQHGTLSQESIYSRAAAATDQLARQVLDGSSAAATIDTVQTHGDYQPANILVDEDEFWIIDWEYAARRQALYDTLVFHCQSRHGQRSADRGIAMRLREFVNYGGNRLAIAENWLPVDAEIADRSLRRRHVGLFLLEELDLRLAENANPRLTALSDGPRQLLHEIESWNSGG